MKKFYSTALAALCALGVSATINVGELRTEAPVRMAKSVEIPAQKTSEKIFLSSEAPTYKSVLPKFSTSVKKSSKAVANGQTIRFEKVANTNGFERVVNTSERVAVNDQLGRFEKVAISNNLVKLESVDRIEKVATKANRTPKKVAPLAEEADYSSIEGEYTIYIGDYYNGTSSKGSIEARATITQNGGEITISSDYFIPVTAAYDEVSGEISFTQKKLGALDFSGGVQYYVRFDPFYYDEAQKNIVVEGFKATYNSNDGSIAFPVGYGFSWRVFKDSRYTANAGSDSSKPAYAGIFDVEGMVRYVNTGNVDLTKIAGEYIIKIGDYYYQDGAGSIEEHATITQDGGEIMISSDYFMTPVYAAYDEETGTITFTQVQFGQVKLNDGSTCYAAFDPFHWDAEAKAVVRGEYEATYNFNNGSISFPADHGFSWGAYNDDQYTDLLGRFDIFDVEGMERDGNTGVVDLTKIAGEYIIKIGDYYYQDGAGSIEEHATITQDGGEIMISSDYFMTPVYAAYDEETGTITFTQVQFGQVKLNDGSTCYAAFDPFHWDAEAKAVVRGEYEATYNFNNGSISFPADHGFSWGAYNDDQYTDLLGRFDIFDVEGMERDGNTGVVDLTKIAGEYIIKIGDYYYQDGAGSIEEHATITQDGGEITISSDYFMTPVYAAYDEETGTITFTQVQFGQVKLNDGSTCYAAFDPFHWDAEAKAVVRGEYEATYNFNDGSISFPADHGFSWSAYNDDQYTDLLGRFNIFDVEGMVRANASSEDPDPVDPGEWNLIGTGIFTNSVASSLTNTEMTPYEVKVYQNALNTSSYKVENAWSQLYAAINSTNASPDLVLDATDKDNVLIGISSLGVSTESLGAYSILNYGFYAYVMDKECEAFTTLKEDENALTFTFEPKSLLLMTEVKGLMGYINDVENTLVVAKDNSSTGVNEVAVDADAPVEYYNLQGVRIDAPAAGQVVIKRQGSAVSKTLVR